MDSPRLIDQQQFLIEQFEQLYSNLGKEPRERRTPARLVVFDTQRIRSWKEIKKIHDQLMAADPPPPEEYQEKFAKASALNEKMKDKLIRFGHPAGMGLTGDAIEQQLVEFNREFQASSAPQLAILPAAASISTMISALTPSTTTTISPPTTAANIITTSAVSPFSDTNVPELPPPLPPITVVATTGSQAQNNNVYYEIPMSAFPPLQTVSSETSTNTVLSPAVSSRSEVGQQNGANLSAISTTNTVLSPAISSRSEVGLSAISTTNTVLSPAVSSSSEVGQQNGVNWAAISTVSQPVTLASAVSTIFDTYQHFAPTFSMSPNSANAATFATLAQTNSLPNWRSQVSMPPIASTFSTNVMNAPIPSVPQGIHLEGHSPFQGRTQQVPSQHFVSIPQQAISMSHQFPLIPTQFSTSPQLAPSMPQQLPPMPAQFLSSMPTQVQAMPHFHPQGQTGQAMPQLFQPQGQTGQAMPQHFQPQGQTSPDTEPAVAELIHQERASSDIPQSDRELLLDCMRQLTMCQVQSMTNANNNSPRANRGLAPKDPPIPTFEGDLLQYSFFKDSVHRVLNDVSWSPEEKFVYARGYLKGRALKVVANLQVAAGSWETMWATLDKNFDRPRARDQAALQMILNANFRIKEGERKAALRNFRDMFESAVSNIRLQQLSGEEIVVLLTLDRLDSITAQRFEDVIRHKALQTTPTIEELSDFLLGEEVALEIGEPRREKPKQPAGTLPIKARVLATTTLEKDAAGKCVICQGEHWTVDCRGLRESPNKLALLKRHRFCFYCARHSWKYNQACPVRDTLVCAKCGDKHITLLCTNENPAPRPASASRASATRDVPASTPAAAPPSFNSFVTGTKSEVSLHTPFLPTAIVPVLSSAKVLVPARGIIDDAGEICFITEHLVQQLKLKKVPLNRTIKAINDTQCLAQHAVELQLVLPGLSEVVKVDAAVLPSIVTSTPRKSIQCEVPERVRNNLADPSFNQPGGVQLLLGGKALASVYYNGGEILTHDGVVYKTTRLGWIVSGVTDEGECDRQGSLSAYVTTTENVQALASGEGNRELLQKIISFLEIPEEQLPSCDDVDRYVEEFYQANYSRDINGRYISPLILKPERPELGESFGKVLGFFLQQERRLLSNPEHHKQVADFMREYEELNHMVEVFPTDEELDDTNRVCYIPHFPVIRTEAVTTKVREVFHASFPTKSGNSLNDILLEGPKLQNSILVMLTRNRTFKFTISGDIEKHFRQILHRPEDSDLLRILWRDSPDQPVRHFKHLRLVYGTLCAPYISIRTLQQCADDNAPTPEVASLIKRGFYIDDLWYGGDSVEKCKELLRDVISTLSAGGFPLTKINSNNPDILANIPEEKRFSAYKQSSEPKILGTIHDLERDEMRPVIPSTENLTYTKRGFSSICSSFFDSFGMLLPYIMLLRMFLRDLWATKCGWDEPLDDKTVNEFNKLFVGIERLKSLSIPRWFSTKADDEVTLIGFADASFQALAAVLYLKKGTEVTFVAAKGRITKIKTPAVESSNLYTIPKLELAALHLLTELYTSVRECFEHLKHSLVCYTDSSIVWHWVRSDHANLKLKYVRRKVKKVLGVIEPNNLHHVKSEENPADIASRGATIEQLLDAKLFHDGPDWLRNAELPKKIPSDSDDDSSHANCFLTTKPAEWDLFAHISSWPRLLRVMMIIQRWTNRVKPSKSEAVPATKIFLFVKRKNKRMEFTTEDFHHATQQVIRYFQRLHLGAEYDDVSRVRSLKALSPFKDDSGVVRVGGRLSRADIEYTQKHPALILGRLREMVIRHTHFHNLHAGNSLTQRLINKEFWIAGIKRLIVKVIRSCEKCARHQQRPTQPIMAPLPAFRVTFTRNYENTGVDLCGPFHVKASLLRSPSLVKVWVAVFVCLATKAVTLEITVGLSAADFLQAFERFKARRGQPSVLWSDHGSNFMGANSELIKASRTLKDTFPSIVGNLEWKTIPVHNPSAGGIWEAAVRAMKFFVKRMSSVRKLTYPEFDTILKRVEYLLNSRPLAPNPISPDEDPALTPNHFLTLEGIKITTLEAVTGLNTTNCIAKRYQEILSIIQSLWKRFQSEVFAEMQKKKKWTSDTPNIKVDEVVIIKTPSQTPGEWPLGRVHELLPDKDNVVREVIVSVKGKLKRLAVRNLIQLFVSPQENEQQLQPPSQDDSNHPAQDDSSHPTPGPRRSKRLAAKANPLGMNTAIMMTMCLIALLQPTAAVQIAEKLSPGIHSIPLGPIPVISGELNFTYNSHESVQLDLKKIDAQVAIVNSICNAASNISRTISTCTLRLNLLKTHAKDVKMTLTSIYTREPSRSRRAVWKLAGKVWKPVKNYIFPVVSTAGVIYEGYEILKLGERLDKAQLEVKETEMRLVHLTNELINRTRDEFDRAQQQRQEDELVEQVNVLAEESTEVIAAILDRHQKLSKFIPRNEIISAVAAKFGAGAKPVFELSSKSFEITNEVLFIHFRVAVHEEQVLEKVAIISVPGNGTYIHISHTNEGTLAAWAAMNKSSGLLTLIDQSDEFFNPFENKAVVEFHIQNVGQQRNYEGIEAEILTKLDSSTVFAFGPATKTVKCPLSQQRYHEEALLIRLQTGCSINTNIRRPRSSDDDSIMLESSDEEIPLAFPELRRPVVSIDNDFADIQREGEELELDITQQIQQLSTTVYNHKAFPFVSSSIVTALTIGIAIGFYVALKTCRKKQRRPVMWVPTYRGPPAIPDLG